MVFIVNKGNSRTISEIKTTELYWRLFGVFIVAFEQVSSTVLFFNWWLWTSKCQLGCKSNRLTLFPYQHYIYKFVSSAQSSAIIYCRIICKSRNQFKRDYMNKVLWNVIWSSLRNKPQKWNCHFDKITVLNSSFVAKLYWLWVVWYRKIKVELLLFTSG